MSMLASQMKWLAYTLEKFEEGNYRALGLYDENRLAAFTMVEYGSFKNYGKQFKMEANEAYLTNMYTFEDYRGQNLAPYLRYQCYKQLQQEGKNQFYSITQYFNKSSLKFKAKLGAQHHELWLHLGLFNKFKRTFLLKRYK